MTQGSSSNSVEAEEDHDYSAVEACHQFVRPRLKAPATADFARYSSASVASTPYYEGGEVTLTRYAVRSYVDSENSFGADMRSSFTCTLEFGDGKWRLTDLDL
jgi:hypothetical protein